MTIAEITSVIGCAYSIPFIPKSVGKSIITGTKQILCRKAPRIKPAVPFQVQEIMNEKPLAINAFCPTATKASFPLEEAF